MLKIKLALFGKRKQPRYRVVVAEANSKRDSGYVALLGHYSPTMNPKQLEIDMKAYQEWLQKGAQPTETVAALAKRLQSATPFPPKKSKPSKKALAKKAGAGKSAAPAPTQPIAAPAASTEPPAVTTTEPTEEAEKTQEKITDSDKSQPTETEAPKKPTEQNPVKK